MTDYRYRLSLRLQHPSLDLAVAASPLGLNPSRVWKAGDPRTTPKRAALEGLYNVSCWTANMAEGTSTETTLDEAIERSVDRLSPHRDILVAIVDDGGKAEFFIGWFFDEENCGEVFGWHLLSRLAELRISLHFDVY